MAEGWPIAGAAGAVEPTTGLDRLWTGWRNTYVSEGGAGSPGTDSVFTRILASGMGDDETLIVHRGTWCFAILNRFPYGTGHLLVLPYREVPDLEDLTAAEVGELWATVTDAVRAIKSAYRPDGVNVGINLGRAAGGSIAQHLHVHLVPRWQGDANFMTTTAWIRTIPEALGDTWAKLHTAWPAGSATDHNADTGQGAGSGPDVGERLDAGADARPGPGGRFDVR